MGEMEADVAPALTFTVVIGRTASPQATRRRVRRWLERLIERGSRAEGFLRGDIQAAERHRLDDWIVVYEFASAATLAAWLESSQRAELIAYEAELFTGPARQQVIAMASPSTSVTVVSSFPVMPGQEVLFASHYQRLLVVVSDFDGFIRSELIPAELGVQRESIVVFSFANRMALDAWLGAEEREAILADMRPLLTGENTMNVVAGFGGWFNPPNRPPRIWKQASLVLLALYPTSLLLSWLRGLALPGLSFAVAVLMVNIVGVSVLSWILMPPLTQRFNRWLRR
ncbi:MAG: antibiotic biosynthesis monooxygenase (ABM) superfamily enzyme [Planctomycetota bacterium]|jgi:antibiotic biosynthesis monooxygenase (ABM) superfamily enzyme